MSLVLRQEVFQSVQSDESLNAASNYSVRVTPVGGRVASASTGSTITFDSAHSFRPGDKFLRVDGAGAYTFSAAISSVTRTTIVFGSETYSVAAGDLLANIGPDTGTTTPAYDGIRIGIFQARDGSSQYLTDKVNTDANGNYRYFHRGDGRMWEVFFDASDLPVLTRPGWAGRAGVYNIADFGAIMDDSTDDTAAINAAILACEETEDYADTVYFPKGTCRAVAGTLNRFPCNIESHPGALVKDTSTSGGNVFFGLGRSGTNRARNRTWDLPGLFKITPEYSVDGTPSATDGGDTGVMLYGSKNCYLHVRESVYFSRGFGAATNSQDISHNDILLGRLSQNVYGVHVQIAADANTFSQNTIRQGNLIPISGVGNDIQNTAAIRLAHNASSSSNIAENTWLDVSLQGEWYHAIDSDGSRDRFVNCRYEKVSGNARVRFNWVGTSSQRGQGNLIVGGNEAETIELTEDPATGNNSIIGGSLRLDRFHVEPSPQADSWRRIYPAASGTIVEAYYPPSVNLAAGEAAYPDFDEDFTYRIGAQYMEMKDTSQAQGRMRLKFSDGRIYWGSGSEDPESGATVVSLGRDGADRLTLIGDQWRHQHSTSGAYMAHIAKSVTLNLSSSGVDSGFFPANVRVLELFAEVTTTVVTSGTSGIHVQRGGPTTILSSSAADPAAGTKLDRSALASTGLVPFETTTAQDLTIAAQSGSLTSGVVVVTAFYRIVGKD